MPVLEYASWPARSPGWKYSESMMLLRDNVKHSQNKATNVNQKSRNVGEIFQFKPKWKFISHWPACWPACFRINSHLKYFNSWFGKEQIFHIVQFSQWGLIPELTGMKVFVIELTRHPIREMRIPLILLFLYLVIFLSIFVFLHNSLL